MRKIFLSCLLVLFFAGLVVCCGGQHQRQKDSDEQILQKIPGFDPNAIVVLTCLAPQQRDGGTMKPGVAFAIGDGTLLLTAAHCVEDFRRPSKKAVSPVIVVISPYYGDIFELRILAVDRETDLAILKAPWLAHPALALASEEQLKAAKRIGIVSRPPEKLKKPPYKLGRQVRTEILPVLRLNKKKPKEAIVLKGTRCAVEGWSGSAMVLPETGKVVGVLLGKSKEIQLLIKLAGITILKWPIFPREDAVGCSVRSIYRLLREHGVEDVAVHGPPQHEPVEDAQPAFSLTMDYFEALAKGDIAKSLTITQELVTLRPESLHAHLFLAYSATARAHEPDAAAEDFLTVAESGYKEAVRLAPDTVHIRTGYGDFLMNLGRNQEALSETEAALAIDPHDRLALVNRLVILARTDPVRAEEFACQLIEKDPNDAHYWHYYGTALLKLGQYEQALEAAQKAVDLDPKGRYEGGLADVLARLDRQDEAERLYKKMTKACGCQRCWYRYARYLVRHRPNKLYEAAKALDAAEAKAHMLRVSQKKLNLLRLRLLEKKSPEKAEALARQLLEKSPENADYFWALAGILRTLSIYEEAVEAARESVRLRPDLPLRPRLANCLTKAGHLEEAEQTYNEMLRLNPDRPKYWFWYTEFLCEYFPDRIEEARQALARTEIACDKQWSVPAEDLHKLREKIYEKINNGTD